MCPVRQCTGRPNTTTYQHNSVHRNFRAWMSSKEPCPFVDDWCCAHGRGFPKSESVVVAGCGPPNTGRDEPEAGCVTGSAKMLLVPVCAGCGTRAAGLAARPPKTLLVGAGFSGSIFAGQDFIKRKESSSMQSNLASAPGICVMSVLNSVRNALTTASLSPRFVSGVELYAIYTAPMKSSECACSERHASNFHFARSQSP
jgi:hypothetical protein